LKGTHPGVPRFILRRLLGSVPAVFAILLVTFLLVRMGGQSPVALLAGPTATREEIQMITAELGLDRPVWEQFAIYAGTIAGGDLGRSWISNRPVLSDIVERLPITLELLFWGDGLGALVGVGVGLRAAWHRDGPFDQVARIVSLIGFSVPTYFLALLALLVFFYALEWAPPGMGRLSMLLTPPPRVTGSFLIDGLIAGQTEVMRSAFAQLVLPVLCIALITAAPTVKQTRAIAIEVLASDYVRYARASGLSPSRVRRIALRSCMVPIVTFIGSELTGLIGTTALIEYVFSWGGLGQYGLNAIIRGDFAAVQGYVLTLACFSVLVFLAVDLIVRAIEPRASTR
jgi:peptide/nickel transport system permease protein